VYVAPIENSARGTLVSDELRDFGVRDLRIDFEMGRIVGFKAEKGEASFKKLLDEARGDKDRIAEFGLGINYAMKRTGLRIYDEKALGTAHVAIGNNTHLGGINRASIHIDFVLYEPTIKAGAKLIMKKGKTAERVSQADFSRGLGRKLV
jgi:leucyl aminopeptidase (aminopeptidase T)